MLQYTNEDIKRKLKQYQLQQPFFNILRNELQQAQEAIAESLTFAAFLPSESRTPPISVYPFVLLTVVQRNL